MLFFFKQKTAYEMRISDWSSDVCSSDLQVSIVHFAAFPELMPTKRLIRAAGQWVRDRITGGYLPKSWFKLSPKVATYWGYAPSVGIFPDADEIGRASCRERVCQYV